MTSQSPPFRGLWPLRIAPATDEPVLFEHDALTRMKQPHIEFILKAGIREVACVRLKNKNEIIGSLVLLSEQDQGFLPGPVVQPRYWN